MPATTKTAISVPQDLLQRCDSVADSLGISRSDLFVQALEEFVDRRMGQHITEKLNEVYSDDTGSGELVRQMRHTHRSLAKGQW